MNKLSELEVCDFDWEIVVVFNFPNQKSEYRMHEIFFKCNAKETMIYGPNIVSIQFGKINF